MRASFHRTTSYATQVATPFAIELVQNAPVRTMRIPGNPAELAESPLSTVPYDDQIVRSVNQGKPLESHSHGLRSLLSRGEIEQANGMPCDVLNPLFDAAISAFKDHRPLALSPDMIWLAICQGFAMHMRLHAEDLRAKFVPYEGKKSVIISRDGFVKGFAGNDWEGAFAEFSDEIAKVVGDEKRGLVVQQFSTTGIVERAAMEVTLMDAMQAYFEYGCTTCCGIPYFLIEGEVSDWEKVRTAAEKFGEYDLDWWMPALLPMLDEFVAAAGGNPDPAFWADFINESGGSGGPYFSGHLTTLFPYVMTYDYKTDSRGPERNSRIGQKSRGYSGLTTDKIPSGLASAPFIWYYYGTEYDMEFVAGFVGVSQDETTLALRPEIGWAVRDLPVGSVQRTDTSVADAMYPQ